MRRVYGAVLVIIYKQTLPKNSYPDALARPHRKTVVQVLKVGLSSWHHLRAGHLAGQCGQHCGEFVYGRVFS